MLIGRINGIWHVQTHVWTPEKGLLDRERKDRAPYTVWEREGFLRATPGATVDYGFVAADIARITAGLEVAGIAYDRWRIDLMRHEFQKIGLDLPLTEWGQGFKDMSPALDTLEAELLNGRIAHGGHPVLSMAAANATTTRDPAGSRKLDKSRATGRIDPLQAMAMAFGLAARTGELIEREDAPLFFV